MERESTPWRVATIVAGAGLAGVVAGSLESAGVRNVFAVVVGLAVAIPLIADGMTPGEVIDDPRRRLQRAGATVLGGLVVGFAGAFALSLASVGNGVVVGIAAGVTYVGGLLVRTWLTPAGPDVQLPATR